MANTKSTKKRARQNEERRKINIARKSDIKTAIKKVLTSIEKGGQEADEIQELMKAAEAKLARAGSKGTLHKKTAARKTGRLAKKVAKATRSASAEAPKAKKAAEKK